MSQRSRSATRAGECGRADTASSRAGVALILVLGMLALMVLLGVAFSIYMQTERIAAGSFKNDVKARNLLNAALAYAMRDVKTQLDAGSNTWASLQSTNGAGGATPVDTNLVQSMLPYVPSEAFRASPLSPSWVEVNPGGTNYIGRIGYVVLNCSGLLDANYAGGLSNGALVPRGVGHSPSELAIDVLPEFRGKDPSLFLKLRDQSPNNYKRFESVQELAVLASNVMAQAPADLVTYSAFPISGYPNGTNITVADISGDENALASRHASIVDAFKQSGLESYAGQSEFIYASLLDYVDANCIPGDLGSASTEAVPMIDEIFMTNRLTFASDGTWTIRPLVKFEWAYPFVRTNANTFWINYTIHFTANNGLSVPGDVTGPAKNSQFAANSTVMDWHEVTVDPGNLPGGNCQAAVGQTVHLTAQFSVEMRLGSAAGAVVDAVPYPAGANPVELYWDFVVPSATNGTTNIYVAADAECFDPRFNWDGSAAGRQWRVTRSPNLVTSPGTINTVTTNYYALYTCDGYPEMYVADRPLMAVSELTYLLRGGRKQVTSRDAWNTIRLFDEAGPSGPLGLDPVLDHFELGTNAVGRGLVNPNTQMTNVLAAVFFSMPVDRYPGDPAGQPLSLDDAYKLALFWRDPSLNVWSGRFAYPSDIGHATNAFACLPLYPGIPFAPALGFQRESILRNASGLFHPRQGFYIVLLFAQVTKDVPLPDGTILKSILSGQRALAEVWMDPLANSEGGHPTLLRYFTIISD